MNRWTYGDFGLAFLAGIVGALAGSIGLVALGYRELDVVSFAVVFAAQSTGSLVALWVAARRRGITHLARATGLVLHVGDLWALAAGMGLQIGVALLFAPFLRLLFPEGPPEQAVADLVASSRGPAEVVMVVLAVVILAPVVEEMLYRGVLLSRLRRSMGPTPAVVVSASAFASVHLLDPNAVAAVPGLFVVGLVLGWVTVRRGDLSLAVPIHAGVNLTAVVLLLYGQDLLDVLQRLADQAGVQAVVHALGG